MRSVKRLLTTVQNFRLWSILVVILGIDDEESNSRIISKFLYFITFISATSKDLIGKKFYPDVFQWPSFSMHISQHMTLFLSIQGVIFSTEAFQSWWLPSIVGLGFILKALLVDFLCTIRYLECYECIARGSSHWIPHSSFFSFSPALLLYSTFQA